MKNKHSVRKSSPVWNRKALSQAIALVTAGLQGPAALGASCTVPGGSTQVETCTLLTGESATISTGGAIIVPFDYAILLSGAGDKTITNDGAVSGVPVGIAGQANGIITINNTANGAISGVSFGESGEQAAGIWLTGSLAATSVLNNSGVISGFASSFGAATADGVILDGALLGAVTNSGTISGEALAGFSARAGGLAVGAVGATGSITNATTGVIGAEAAAIFSFNDASAEGLAVGAVAAGGTVTNSGTINAEASAWESKATGVVVGVNAGTITNNSDIFAIAGLDGGESLNAAAFGVDVESNTGSIINSATGAISASAFAYFSTVGENVFATATGVNVGTNSATITNNGEITANAQALTEFNGGVAYARAMGLDVGTIAESGVVVNDGSISATASAFGEEEGIAVATGVAVGELYGSLDNGGTIAAFASANSSSAIADGLSIGYLEGTVANSGTISADATATGFGFAFADAVGLRVGIGEGASVTNDGSITADASSQFAAQARGAVISNSGGTFTNNATGSIEANASAFLAQATGLGTGFFSVFSGGAIDNRGVISASAFGSQASAFGVRINDTFDGLNGSIDNSGSIAALADGGEGATADGILVNWIGESGSIFNDGDVTATATAGFDAAAVGISVGGMSSGASIENALGGVISASASASNAIALGIDINSSVGPDATITNAGTIGASAIGSSESVEAYGVNVGGYFQGTLANTGGIEAFASGGSDATAVGLQIDSTVDVVGSITNSGTISGSATASDTAYAVGVRIVDDLDGTLDNSGSILADASGFDGAEAIGVHVLDDVDGVLINSDTIAATASGLDGAEALGIWVEDDLEGDLENSGAVTASASAGSFASAIGIFVSTVDLTGSLTNTGSISAIAAATYGAYAAGTYIGELLGTVDNSGSIAADASADGGANAQGAFVGFIDETGTFHNGGAISASATAFGFTYGEMGTTFGGVATAAGVATGQVAGTLSNDGTIEATADGAEGAGALGIVGDFVGIAGSVANSGEIGAFASAGSDAFAAGISYFGVAGDVDNSGTIAAAAAASGSAEAFGIQMFGVDSPGRVTNRGEISASASASGFAEASGISAIFVDGTIDNSGTINASAAAAYSASAFGMIVEEVLGAAGTVSNTGTINVSAAASGITYAGTTSTGGYAYAGGMTAGFVDGVLDNAGTIDVAAEGLDGAVAYGMGAQELGALGVMLNDEDGEISVAATATEDAFAAGIGVLDGAEGTIENRGRINAAASASTLAGAAGIYVGDSVTSSGSITNSGFIGANAFAGLDGAEAYGIYVEDRVDGSIDNSGTIVAAASGTEFATAFGIYVSSTLGEGGSLTNSGTINVSASASGSATAGGIAVFAVDGTLTNTGTITVGADGGESTAFGIATAYLGPDGSIVNTGDIDVTANGAGTTGEGSFSSGAVGVFVGFMNAGTTLTNSGTIAANTDAGAGSGWAVWVDGGEGSGVTMPMVLNSGVLDGNVRLFGASLDNTGLVSLPTSTGNFGDSSYVGGNYTQSGAGVFEIDVESDSVYGRMYVEGVADISGSGDFNVNVLPANSLAAGDVLDNVIYGDDGLVTGAMSVTDDSLLWNFTAINDGESGVDLRADVGVSPESAVGSNGPVWALPAAGALGDVIYGGEAGGDFADVIASLSTLGSAAELSEATAQMAPLLAGQSAQAASLSLDTLGSIVTGRLDSHRAGVVTEQGRDQNLWMRGFGQMGEQDEDNDYPGWEIEGAGVVIGYDQDFGGTWNVGAAIAYSESDVDSDSIWIEHEIEAETLQGALYAYWNGEDGMYVDLMGVFGTSENDSTRKIVFADVAREAAGEFDTTFMRFSGAFGKSFEVSEGMTFTPIVDIAYTTVEDDSYTETGAGDLNLAVDDSEVEALIIGLDGRLGMEMGASTLFTAHAGIGYDTMTDDTTIAAAFVGAGPAFLTTSPEPDEMLIRAGAGAEFAPSDNAEIHFNYEYEYRDTFQNNLVTATLRWKF